MSKKLEIACFNLASAKIASKAGADRIEFCDDYASGGITPSLADFKVLRAICSKPIYVMIRPRAGDFVYTDEEINQMRQSISYFYQAGADGFVFGCLTAKRTIDIRANDMLINTAQEKACTFHRAFDETKDWSIALEDIIACGFNTILSSGRAKNALEGLSTFLTIKEAAKNRIVLMPGGGLRASNIAAFSNAFETEYYHSAAIKDNSFLTDKNEIEKMKALLA